MMFGAMFLVMVKGTIDIGGFGLVWEKAVESGRIELPEWVICLKWGNATLLHNGQDWTNWLFSLFSDLILI